MTLFYIYIIENKLNGKMYIGKAKKPERRWAAHISNSKKKSKHQYYIQRAIAKYGVDNFWFRVVDFYFSENKSLEAERYWIKFHQSNVSKFGYNLTDGGEGASGFKHSSATREKLSELAKLRTSKDNSFYGKKHSDQTKMKIRKARRKLNDNEITSLLRERIIDGVSLSKLSSKYGLSSSHVFEICRGKYWQHLYNAVKNEVV